MEDTSRTLQLLYSLDTSSPGFLPNLRLLIQHDKKEKYLIKLKRPELTRLLDLLDKVRTAPSTLLQFQDRLLQAFDVIPTNDDLARKCLKKVYAICAARKAFPSSHILSDEIENLRPLDYATSGRHYLWGTYRGEEVEMMKMVDDRGRGEEVCTQSCVSSRRLLMDIPACRRCSPI